MKQQILNSSHQHGLVPPFSTARSHTSDSRSRTRATPAPVKGMSCTRGPLIGSQLDKEEVWPVKQSSESQATPTLESRPTSVDAESPEGRTPVPRQKHKWRPRSTVVSITRSVRTDRALDSPPRSSTLTPSQTTPLTSTRCLCCGRIAVFGQQGNRVPVNGFCLSGNQLDTHAHSFFLCPLLLSL